MKMMGNEINWTAFQKYWTPTPGMEHDVVLANWLEDEKQFGKSSEKKIVLIFKVLQVQDEVFDPALEYTTSGNNALKFRSAIDAANRRGEDTIFVRILCKPDKKIEVVDMNVVNKVISGLNNKYKR